MVTDVVGFLPNIRKSDNLIQAYSALGGMVLGAPIGIWLFAPLFKGSPFSPGTAVQLCAVMGAGSGGIIGLFLSGFVVMVRGWVRTLQGTK